MLRYAGLAIGGLLLATGLLADRPAVAEGTRGSAWQARQVQYRPYGRTTTSRNSRLDTDRDGIPNVRDWDDDNDGIADDRDSNPKTRNRRSITRDGRADTDRDGIPNYRDWDDDNDGIGDTNDPYPRRANRSRVRYYDGARGRTRGWGTSRSDLDRDGIPDYRDRDRDGDGVSNSRDRYDRNRNRR